MEWRFRNLKRVFGFTKVSVRGLKKNHEWLCAAIAPVNLYQHRNRLAPQRAQCAGGGRYTASERPRKHGKALFERTQSENAEEPAAPLRRYEIRH